MRLLNRVPACQRVLRACVPARSRCQCACVPTCQSVPSSYFLRANVPKNVRMCHTACQCFNLACQRPKSVPIFQTFLLRNAKGNSYTLLLYERFYIILDIILIHIMCVCIVHINCIILYFLKLFCSLDRNGNIKTPGFYTLQVTREYCDLLEL